MPPEHPAAPPATSKERSSPGGGVIHDLGYRPYEGQRLGRNAIRRALFVDGLRGAYGLGRTARSKVMPMLLLAAMTLPALIMVVIAAVTRIGSLPAPMTSYLVAMQVVVAIYVAVQAPVAVSRDLRFRVMSLYLARPLERIDYVAAKYGSLAAAVLVLAATPLTVMFVGALLAGLPLREQLTDYLAALAGAALIAMLVAGLGLVIAAVTPRRGIGIAAIVTVLLVVAGVQGMTADIAWMEGAETTAQWLSLLSPFTLADGVQATLLGAEAAMFTAPDQVVQGLVFLAAAVLFIAGSFGALLLRYRRVSVS